MQLNINATAGENYDVIVVGSGPSSIAAAIAVKQALQPRKINPKDIQALL